MVKCSLKPRMVEDFVDRMAWEWELSPEACETLTATLYDQWNEMLAEEGPYSVTSEGFEGPEDFKGSEAMYALLESTWSFVEEEWEANAEWHASQLKTEPESLFSVNECWD